MTQTVCRADLGLVTRRTCYTGGGCRSAECRKAEREYARQYRKADAGVRARRYRNKHRYGITLSTYDEILAAQGGVCAICGKECPTGDRLSIDHDHESGRMRGLLCRRCNTGIGQFNDDPSLLAVAIAYLCKELP